MAFGEAHERLLSVDIRDHDPPEWDGHVFSLDESVAVTHLHPTKPRQSLRPG